MAEGEEDYYEVEEYDESEFQADEDLSEIISKLWDLDENKCWNNHYELDLQGYVTNAREVGADHAHRKLFKWVDEDAIFALPTYAAFKALLDNYELDVSEDEVVTMEERQENWTFLNAIMETNVMKGALEYLSNKGVVQDDEEAFKKLLHDIWFKLFKRKGGRGQNSCSFEHVFVGEGRDDDMIGLHNWIQFYLQEKAGHIDYHGYFSRDTIKSDEIIRLLAIQFHWRGIMGKPLCSVFVGSSPEFEIAAYTVCLLLDKDGKVDIKMGEYEVELTVHSMGWKNSLGTAYFSPQRIHSAAQKKGWHSKKRYGKPRN